MRRPLESLRVGPDDRVCPRCPCSLANETGGSTTTNHLMPLWTTRSLESRMPELTYETEGRFLCRPAKGESAIEGWC